MKLPNPEEFNFRDCIIGGDECFLIFPNDIKAKWNEENLHFRSIILRKNDHKVISVGFKKFHNLFEKPDLDPFPDGEFDCVDKMDGSLLICSCHNNEFIFRTRGTSDVRILDNGNEIDFLLEKYPKIRPFVFHNSNYSILFEWETPSNRTVIDRVKEPTLTLIGIVNHEDFFYVSQEELDEKAKVIECERPQKHHFNSIKECVNDVKYWKGKEGVVIYSKDGQSLRKIKADEYLRLHKIFSGYKTIKSFLDLFMVSDCSTYSGFYNFVERTVDYEIAEQGKDFMEQITNAYTSVMKKKSKVDDIVDKHSELFSRKEKAQIFQEHWKDWRLSYAFSYLDGVGLSDKLLRKAIENEL